MGYKPFGWRSQEETEDMGMPKGWRKQHLATGPYRANGNAVAQTFDEFLVDQQVRITNLLAAQSGTRLADVDCIPLHDYDVEVRGNVCGRTKEQDHGECDRTAGGT
jgi:hypothetical protein